MAEWIDLLDPDRTTLEQALPKELHEETIEQLSAPVMHDDEPRPRLEARGTYVFGVYVVPECVDEKDLEIGRQAQAKLTSSTSRRSTSCSHTTSW